MLIWLVLCVVLCVFVFVCCVVFVSIGVQEWHYYAEDPRYSVQKALQWRCDYWSVLPHVVSAFSLSRSRRCRLERVVAVEEREELAEKEVDINLSRSEPFS